jgi:hypothetical protein
VRVGEHVRSQQLKTRKKNKAYRWRSAWRR